MAAPTSPNAPDAESAARTLYAQVLRCWNERDAPGFAALFTLQSNMVGFDGSPIDGSAEIEAHLRAIFGHHPTAAYVGKVREVRRLGSDGALLRAVAGMVPPGHSELNPALNTIHSLVAARHGEAWRIELFQSTPAAFHGRQEASDALTAELRREYEARRE